MLEETGLSNIVIKPGSATGNKNYESQTVEINPNIGNYQNGQYVEIKFGTKL